MSGWWFSISDEEAAAGSPGGGGFGFLMHRRHFERYQVDGKWRGVERVRATPLNRRPRKTTRSR